MSVVKHNDIQKNLVTSDDMVDLSQTIEDYVTMTVDSWWFGVPVLKIQDILGPQHITRVPLAPRAIAGFVNLRGRIVTTIDLRVCLNIFNTQTDLKEAMSIVVEYRNELYSFLVDAVGEVLSLAEDSKEIAPATLDPLWTELATGIYRLDKSLLMTLDIFKIIESIKSKLPSTQY